jgi:hypothetical protein
MGRLSALHETRTGHQDTTHKPRTDPRNSPPTRPPSPATPNHALTELASSPFCSSQWPVGFALHSWGLGFRCPLVLVQALYAILCSLCTAVYPGLQYMPHVMYHIHYMDKLQYINFCAHGITWHMVLPIAVLPIAITNKKAKEGPPPAASRQPAPAAPSWPLAPLALTTPRVGFVCCLLLLFGCLWLGRMSEARICAARAFPQSAGSRQDHERGAKSLPRGSRMSSAAPLHQQNKPPSWPAPLRGPYRYGTAAGWKQPGAQ